MGQSALATVVTGPWALLLCSGCPWRAKRGGRGVIPHTTVRAVRKDTAQYPPCSSSPLPLSVFLFFFPSLLLACTSVFAPTLLLFLRHSEEILGGEKYISGAARGVGCDSKPGSNLQDFCRIGIDLRVPLFNIRAIN